MAASLMKCIYEAWVKSRSKNDIYHMGSIILWNPDIGRNAGTGGFDMNQGHSNDLFLMDGQQRVTTLYLIFALIRHYMSKRASENSSIFRLYRDYGWMVSSLTSLYTPLPMLSKILSQSTSLICLYAWAADIWISRGQVDSSISASGTAAKILVGLHHDTCLQKPRGPRKRRHS